MHLLSKLFIFFFTSSVWACKSPPVPPSPLTSSELQKFQLFQEVDYTHPLTVSSELEKKGLKNTSLIFAVDFSEANKRQRLHDIGDTTDGYIFPLATTGVVFDLQQSKDMVAYAWGIRHSSQERILALKRDNSMCKGYPEVLRAYRERAKNRPEPLETVSFIKVIEKSAKRAKNASERFHVLVLLTAAGPDDVEKNAQTILKSAEHPLSIIVVGVGEGPWHKMALLQDKLAQTPSSWDNFTFVNIQELLKQSSRGDGEKLQAIFAFNAFQKLPAQYAQIEHLGILKR